MKLEIPDRQESASVPALSQSRRGDMACELLYVHKHVFGTRMGESQPAARGIELHRLLSTYIDHLIAARRRIDLEVFDDLARDLGKDAREAISKFRNNHAFDPERIVGTELYIALDEDFRPLDSAADDHIPAYEGTLDLVTLNSLTEAEITDWKSYYQIIEADTFQSQLYPLLLMCLNPRLESVKFSLEFIRYGASRWVEYTRSDMPRLIDIAKRERARQHALHNSANNPVTFKASPGRHCTWCPVLLNDCPLAQTNPYARMTPEARVRFGVWLQEAEKENTRILKQLLLEHGPICYADGNQKEYFAGFVPVEKRLYPYELAAPIVDSWLDEHPEDSTLLSNLTVSGLSPLLKAEKRHDLARQLLQIADTRVDTELRLGPQNEHHS